MKAVKKVMGRFLPEKKKYIVVGLLVVAVAIGLNQGGTGLEVQGTTVDIGVVQRYVEEVGEFTAKTAITVNGRVSGVVESVYKVEGDPVKAGDLIMELDKKDMEIQITGTEAEIDAVYAELAEAGRTDKNEVSQVKSRIALAQNTYVKSKEDYERNQVLFESGAVSKTDLDTSKRLFEDSEESLKIAQNDLTLLTKGISDSLKKQYESRIGALTAKLELEKRQLEQMSIKAPIDGILTDKYATRGDTVSFGSPLVEVSDPNAFHVTADLLVSDAGKTKVGYKVLITDPEGTGQWMGKINKIFPKAFTKLSDLGIEQKRVKVEIGTEDMIFDRFGYEFDIKIIFEEKEAILRCKDSAVFQIDGAYYVFKVVDGQTVLTEITIGLEGEEYVEVISGLSVGDAIVQSPGNDIEEGMRVILK
jgi:HlyD family secretion protein